MTCTYGISEEEMGRMLLESLQNAKEDIKIRGIIEARTEAENVILASLPQIHQTKRSDPHKGRNRRDDKARSGPSRESVKGEDKDNIHQSMEDLNEYTTPLAHRALDANIADAMKGKKL